MRNGKQYVESLKDNRTIYIGGERVKDVTTHPAFAGIVNTFSKMYDMSADPANGMTYTTEDGTVANKMFMIPRSREDLAARREAMYKWAEAPAVLPDAARIMWPVSWQGSRAIPRYSATVPSM